MEIRRDMLQNWDILIVDDDPDSLNVAMLVLKHYGANVHLATGGREALNKLQMLSPQFIISDISMPEMDGWEFIEELKHDRRTENIPVIALTANVGPGYREKVIAAGFHNYLVKPLTASTFIKELLILLVEIPQFAGQLS